MKGRGGISMNNWWRFANYGQDKQNCMYIYLTKIFINNIIGRGALDYSMQHSSQPSCISVHSTSILRVRFLSNLPLYVDSASNILHFVHKALVLYSSAAEACLWKLCSIIAVLSYKRPCTPQSASLFIRLHWNSLFPFYTSAAYPICIH